MASSAKVIRASGRQRYTVHSDGIEGLQTGIADEYGFKLLGHAHYLYGICPECRKKETE